MQEQGCAENITSGSFSLVSEFILTVSDMSIPSNHVSSYQSFSLAKNHRLQVEYENYGSNSNSTPTFDNEAITSSFDSSKYPTYQEIEAQFNASSMGKKIKVVHNYCAAIICHDMKIASDLSNMPTDPIKTYFDANNHSVLCEENLSIVNALMQEAEEVHAYLKQSDVSHHSDGHMS
jgi:hypothetical protein